MLPRADEYSIAVQNPSSCFSDGDLKHGQVQTNNLGLPVPYSGGFTTTYRISNGNFNYAVRCFTREVGHLHTRYQAIDEFIDNNKCDYLVEARYLKLGIQINGKWAPIIKMKWIDGDLLSVYIGKIVSHDKEAIVNFLDKFEKFIEKMEKDKLAHGDLQHGNIIIKNDRIFLIDYDGLYLPELENIGTGEIGHPNYQHAKRTTECFDSEVDRFSAVAIYLSLKALIIKPELWKKYYNGENIIFKKDDFIDPENSAVLFDLTQLPELKEDAEHFATICKGDYKKIPSLKDFIYNEKKYPKIAINKPAQEKAEISKEGFDIFSKLYGSTVITTSGGFNYKPTTTLSGGQNTQHSAQASPMPQATPPIQGGKSSAAKGLLYGILAIVGFGALVALGVYLDDSSTTNNTDTIVGSQNSTSTAGNFTDCSMGMVKSEKTSQCVTRAVYCTEKDGAGSVWDGNYCNCGDGFVRDGKGNKCVTRNQRCKESYGNASKSVLEAGEYKCGCVSGYTLNSNQTSCIKDCTYDQCLFKGQCIDKPLNSYCANNAINAWKCNTGYNESGNLCIKNDLDANGCGNTRCAQDYGSNSVFRNFDSTKNSCICDCATGYDWNKERTFCFDYNTSCSSKYLNTKFDGTFGTNGGPICNCKIGYEWNAAGTSCIKKCGIYEYKLGDYCYTFSELDKGCKDTGGLAKYFTGTISNGKYMCDCLTGYHFSGTYCVSD